MGHCETECVTVPFKACPLTFDKTEMEDSSKWEVSTHKGVN